MNSGFVISYIIGGVMLMAILFMNMNVSRSSSELTMRQITQQSLSVTSEILSHDMQKIGFDRFQKLSNPVLIADSNRIQFKSNIDNSGSTEIVEWYFDPSSTLSSSTNPDAHALKRIVGSEDTNINAGVTSFKLTYMDSTLNVIPTPIASQSARNNIRHIKVEMNITSKEVLGRTSGGREYIRSSQEKIFSPKNLKN